MHWAKPVALISEAKVGKIPMHIRTFPSLNSLFRKQRKNKRDFHPKMKVSAKYYQNFPSTE